MPPLEGKRSVAGSSHTERGSHSLEHGLAGRLRGNDRQRHHLQSHLAALAKTVVQIGEPDIGRVTSHRQVAGHRHQRPGDRRRGSASHERAARRRNAEPRRVVREHPVQRSRASVGQQMILRRRTEWASDRATERHDRLRRDSQRVDRREQGLDQVAPGRRSPTGAKVVPCDREKLVGAAAIGVVAGRDVVESGQVIRPLADGIDGRVDKADGRLAHGRRLLIHQGGESSPQRRRRARAAHHALFAIVDDDPDRVVCQTRHVGNVPHRR